MDDLTYYYDAAKRHNRLRGVRDAVTGAQTGDLSSQMASETSADNYAYDVSGNLISDTQGGLSVVSWNLSGKLRNVTKTDGRTVEYRYDAAGQRVAQTAEGRTTHYLRDASGNVMAIYEENLLTEHHLYGSSRLGTRRQGEAPRTLTLGHKSYELSNHLSNVMAVISDHKLPEGNSWRAYVQSRTDYYAFGAAMPGRSGEGPYRYGLNGQEKGSLFPGHYTALYWEYDSRLGRRWNVDPKPNESISSYATLGLNPILNADPQGDTIIFPGTMWWKWNKQFPISFRDDIYKLYEGWYGKSLIRYLHASKVKIHISDASSIFSSDEGDVYNSKTMGDYPSGYTADRGHVSVTYAGNEDVLVDKTSAKSFLVLAHEFVHAKDIASGYFKKIMAKYKLKEEILREIAEVRAMAYTNLIAKEQKINEIRTDYAGKKLLNDDGITPIKDYGFDIMEDLFPNKNEPTNSTKKK